MIERTAHDCVNRETGQPCDWRDPQAVLVEVFQRELRRLRRRQPLERALRRVTRLLESESSYLSGEVRPALRKAMQPAWGATDEVEDPRRPVPPMGMTPDSNRAVDEFFRRPGQRSKEQVNYAYSGDEDRQCGACEFFQAPSGCQLVAGLIRRVDRCDLWTQA